MAIPRQADRRIRSGGRVNILLYGSARDGGVFHLVDPVILFRFLIFDRFRPVHIQEFDNLIAVNPYFIISLFLRLIEDKLHPKMKMGIVDIVGVFRPAVPGAPQIADHVACLDDAAFL